MNIAPYKIVLSLPGLRTLMLIGFLARIPVTAVSMTITLHVVNSLGLGYGAAGVAGAIGMAGVGVGAPLAGRFTDRVGLRPVLVVTTIAQGVFWAVAPSLSYPLLVVFSFISGVLALPVFSVMRQFVAAMVPAEQRRTAFALDSMAVELSFMIGPAVAVAAVTSLSSQWTMYGVGAGIVASGLLLIMQNPPIRSEEEEAEQAAAVPRRQWLTPAMITLLGITMATTFVLASTELSVVAVLNHDGAVAWTGLVIALWCAYSVVGGFIYGGLRRSLSPLVLIGGLAALTAPIGLIGGGWWWLTLALVPAGLLCAPSLSATVDTVSHWVPASARGEAMGLHGTALTIGVAVGAPLAGAVIDAFGPGWGFATAGGVGLLLVAVAVPFWPRNQQQPHLPAEPKAEPAAQLAGV